MKIPTLPLRKVTAIAYVPGILFITILLQGCPIQMESEPVPAEAPPPSDAATEDIPMPSSSVQVPQATPVADSKRPPEKTAERVPPKAPSDMDIILSDSTRVQPGKVATSWLYYRDRDANKVQVSGAWDGWQDKTEMQPVGNGVWAMYIGGVDAPFGRYEFKFIVNETWEGGANRLLTLNEEGQMEKPPEVIAQTLIRDPHTLRVQLYREPRNRSEVEVALDPPLGNLDLEWTSPNLKETTSGYQVTGKDVEFVFDPDTYGMNTSEILTAVVSGTFSNWNPDTVDYRLKRQADGTWRARTPYTSLDRNTIEGPIMFKFVINGEWKNPPASAPNTMLEPGTPHMNLTLPRPGDARPELRITTEEPIDLRRPPALIVNGLHTSALKVRPTPGKILDTLDSDQPVGVTLDRENQQTTYRLFAPRATSVHIGLFDGPYHTLEDGTRVKPAERLLMTRRDDGTWEYRVNGLQIGQYYAFQVEGRHGEGEGFNGNVWIGDPYAKAVSLAEGNSIVMDLNAQAVNPLPRPRVAWEDMVIYETHIRHLTQHPSSGVPEDLRGTYPGLLATRGTGTGIDHLKSLGVNVVQFLPIHEFNNGFGRRHDWGYATCFFFAPESSYATDPLNGSQVAEFKQLVDELHQEGFAVFLDVVYNHIGGVNIFNQIDRKYYFRLNPDLTKQNFSGCGNDTASERPMFRKLIKDSVLFWVEEYGIDGFRFDLAELIDDETLSQIEAEIREKHPHVVLHSEPWSFRGHHKDFLGPTSWGGWNDQFREPAKRFVTGRGDVTNMKKAIRGSVESWTTHPLQSVNYMESHDDLSLTDELSNNPGNDGRELSYRDERIHKLASTMIFSSLGTPMITEGQAYLRSKHGIRNTYNQGDRINSLRWEERGRPYAAEVLNYYKEMIDFRLSEAGRALRVPPGNPPSLDYVRFMDPGDGTSLGWLVNGNAERPNVPAVLVLMNAGTDPAAFDVDLPRGAWRQIGNGNTVQADGIDGTRFIPGGRKLTVSVPPQTALLFRNGF